MNNRLRIALASPHKRQDELEWVLKSQLHLDVLRVRDQSSLNLASLMDFGPEYVFFPHWSWKIPAEIYERFECVIFHMTDLPFGRGGSPLQNLVARGIKETKLTALRCGPEIDAGPIYMKRPLSLLGTAEEILMRASKLTGEMIEAIVRERPTLHPQVGEPTILNRRTAQEGNLASLETLEKVFDFIRMLDGEGYPPAFLETAFFKLEFSRASLKQDCVIADVKIIRKES